MEPCNSSLFSIAQTVIIACIPHALNGQSMWRNNVSDGTVFRKLTKQNGGVINK